MFSVDPNPYRHKLFLMGYPVHPDSPVLGHDGERLLSVDFGTCRVCGENTKINFDNICFKCFPKRAVLKTITIAFCLILALATCALAQKTVTVWGPNGQATIYQVYPNGNVVGTTPGQSGAITGNLNNGALYDYRQPPLSSGLNHSSDYERHKYDDPYDPNSLK
jgi:hypothetical protein